MKEIDWFARNLGEALNTLDQAITIVDKAGRFVYYNRASARMDGQDADKILGRHVLEINPWLTEEDSTLLRCIRDGVRFVDSYQPTAAPVAKNCITCTVRFRCTDRRAT